MVCFSNGWDHSYSPILQKLDHLKSVPKVWILNCHISDPHCTSRRLSVNFCSTVTIQIPDMSGIRMVFLLSAIQMNPVFGCPVFGWLLHLINIFNFLQVFWRAAADPIFYHTSVHCSWWSCNWKCRTIFRILSSSFTFGKFCQTTEG